MSLEIFYLCEWCLRTEPGSEPPSGWWRHPLGFHACGDDCRDRLSATEPEIVAAPGLKWEAINPEPG